MTTPTLLPAPDIYGYTIFCDDIRYEVGGKVSFMGSYAGTMILNSPFPATLPMLAMCITIAQRKRIFVPSFELRIFLPGDPDEIPSIQAQAGENAHGAIVAAAAAETDALHPDSQGLIEDGYIALNNHLRLGQLVIKQPGVLKVRALVGDNMVRLGGLLISPSLQFAGNN